MSTPSQVGSKKHWSLPNDIREVRQREKAPKVNQGGVSMATQVTTGTGEPKGGMRRASN